MEKLLRRELVYSVSETSLWGRFLLSLKKLKYEVRGRAADNPPEVEKCKVLTANSIYLLQKHHRPLALDAWATLTGRSFDDDLQSRPSASFHPRGRASRRPSKNDRLAAVHQAACMRPSTTDPSRWMRRPLHVQDVARAALRDEQQRELAAEQALNNLRRQRDFSLCKSPGHDARRACAAAECSSSGRRYKRISGSPATRQK